jgi:apolipoprotein N-acyltransferase
MIVLMCAALSGILFYFAHGVDAIWVLAWIAPLPLLWLAYGETRRWQLFLAGIFAFAAGQIYFLPTYGLVLLPTAGVAMLGGGAMFAATLLFARAVWRRLPVWWTPFAFPALWTAVEYLESLVSPHGSWGALGYSQVAWPAAIQMASLFGVCAISFLLCLFANALALAVRGARMAGLAGVALCVLALVFGYVRLAQPMGETVGVAALADEGRAYQRAFRTGDPAAAREVAAVYAAAIRAEAARGARFFVTPEGGVAAQGEALGLLEKAAQDTGAVIVAGVSGNHPPRNSALAFTPDGRVTSYDKRHLLLPLESRFTPGQAPGLIGDGRAMAICKDLDFPRTIRADAQHGIRLMAVPASDFMKDDWIHARMAVLRGVENGFAVVRSAFNGLEMVSDAQGRVLASARINRPGLIVARAEVSLGPGPTLYTRIGDVFAWLCLAVALGLAAWLFRKQLGQA